MSFHVDCEPKGTFHTTKCIYSASRLLVSMVCVTPPLVFFAPEFFPGHEYKCTKKNPAIFIQGGAVDVGK